MTAWEKLCRRCGLCCFEKKIGVCGRMITTRVPCQHLDIISRECRVYHKRLSMREGCIKLTPEVVVAADWLPESCAYRQQSGTCPEGSGMRNS